jgi:transcription factor-like protein
MAHWHLEQLEFVLQHYGTRMYPFLSCPPSLFAEVVRINYLRMRVARLRDDSPADDFIREAFAILNRITNFSPEEWALSKPYSQHIWLSMGNIYRTSITIYCIASLQSLSALPRTHTLRSRRAEESQKLHSLLSDAVSETGIGRFMLWPMVILGTEAVNGRRDMRCFVKQHLPEMSRHVGSSTPLTAMAILERYWASGCEDWDLCFDKPYMLTAQIAVDLSGLSPP